MANKALEHAKMIIQTHQEYIKALMRAWKGL
jgi:hypothetical protein